MKTKTRSSIERSLLNVLKQEQPYAAHWKQLTNSKGKMAKEVFFSIKMNLNFPQFGSTNGGVTTKPMKLLRF
jgi:hypothetical protein